MLQSLMRCTYFVLLQTVWWACVGVSVGANAPPHIHIKHLHCSVRASDQNNICVLVVRK